MTLTSHANNLLIETAIEALALQGYAILPEWFCKEQVQSLSHRVQMLKMAHLLTPASTGKVSRLDTSVRGDHTYWLANDSPNLAEQQYLASMHTLQGALNQAFYFGLNSIESHFAIYPVGTFYKKHLDQFKNNQPQQDAMRKVSSVLYLNEDWQADDGGQLRLYLDENKAGQMLDISPTAGTLVLFMSARFYHEVLPAKRERLSVTGWFKTRDSTLL
jgi:SM-20-related protein